MPPLPPWDGAHPVIVHLPIALAAIAPLALLAALLWRTQRHTLLVVASALLILASIGAALATASGEAGESWAERAAGGDAERARAIGLVLHEHEEAGELARNLIFIATGLTLAWTVLIRLRGSRLPRIAAPLGTAALTLASVVPAVATALAGHEGGRLVHEFGVRAPINDAARRSLMPPPPRAAITPRVSGPAIPLPAPDATAPAELPGLHQLVAYTTDVVSGALPETPEAFDSLSRLGIRTILSVDGASTDAQAAEARGMRYVHLPITYAGFDNTRRLELARVLRDLPRPIYVHCHHGKHRSAAAAAAALVTLGELAPEAAQARMKVSQTSPGYKGLWSVVATATTATPDDLDRVVSDFPSCQPPQGLVDAMLRADALLDRLKAAKKSAWPAPAGAAPDAALLADVLRSMESLSKVQAASDDYRIMLRQNAQAASSLEDTLLNPASTQLERDQSVASLIKSCNDCHAAHRD